MGKSILIDTQVLVWLFQDRTKIGVQALACLEAANQPVAVSYISIMEIVIKEAANGKLHYDDKVFDDLALLDIEVITPSRPLLQYYHIFSPDNKDPFDNLLIATALEQGCDFMTTDHKILGARIPELGVIDAAK
jgi:PIN domain nuclease of toxin-antitoxin system